MDWSQPLKLNIYKRLSKWNYEKASVVLLILLSLQPLYSILYRLESYLDVYVYYYSKAFAIRVLGILCLLNGIVALYCKFFILGKEFVKRFFLKNGWTLLGILVLLWGLISSFVNGDPYQSMGGDAYRFEGYISYIAYAGIFLSASLLKKNEYKRKLLIYFAAASGFLAVATILKEASNTSLILFNNGQIIAYSGTFINSNHYGYYLAVSILVCTGLYNTTEKLYSKIIYGSLFFINVVVLLLNGSLGPYLAILLGLAFYIIFTMIRNGFKKSWPVLILVGILLVATIIFNGKDLYNDITRTLKEMGVISSAISSDISTGSAGESASTVNGGSGRWQLWVACVKVILAYPIFGVGPERIQEVITMYGASEVIPHNEYLQMTANMGIPAGIFYISMLVWMFIRLFRKTKKVSELTLVAAATALTYGASAFVGVSMTICACYFFLFLGLMNSWNVEQDEIQVLEIKTEPEVTTENQIPVEVIQSEQIESEASIQNN